MKRRTKWVVPAEQWPALLVSLGRHLCGLLGWRLTTWEIQPNWWAASVHDLSEDVPEDMYIGPIAHWEAKDQEVAVRSAMGEALGLRGRWESSEYTGVGHVQETQADQTPEKGPTNDEPPPKAEKEVVRVLQRVRSTLLWDWRIAMGIPPMRVRDWGDSTLFVSYPPSCQVCRRAWHPNGPDYIPLMGRIKVRVARRFDRSSREWPPFVPFDDGRTIIFYRTWETVDGLGPSYGPGPGSEFIWHEPQLGLVRRTGSLTDHIRHVCPACVINSGHVVRDVLTGVAVDPDDYVVCGTRAIHATKRTRQMLGMPNIFVWVGRTLKLGNPNISVNGLQARRSVCPYVFCFFSDVRYWFFVSFRFISQLLFYPRYKATVFVWRILTRVYGSDSKWAKWVEGERRMGGSRLI